MKSMLAVALLLALGTPALAVPAPVEQRIKAIFVADDSPVLMGPAGATLEQDYFRAPATPFGAQRVFPCRLHMHLFEKTRLAQSCN